MSAAVTTDDVPVTLVSHYSLGLERTNCRFKVKYTEGLRIMLYESDSLAFVVSVEIERGSRKE